MREHEKRSGKRDDAIVIASPGLLYLCLSLDPLRVFRSFFIFLLREISNKEISILEYIRTQNLEPRLRKVDYALRRGIV